MNHSNYMPHLSIAKCLSMKTKINCDLWNFARRHSFHLLTILLVFMHTISPWMFKDLLGIKCQKKRSGTSVYKVVLDIYTCPALDIFGHTSPPSCPASPCYDCGISSFPLIVAQGKRPLNHVAFFALRDISSVANYTLNKSNIIAIRFRIC